MRRVITLVLALCLAGCDTSKAAQVPLLTGQGPNPGGCFSAKYKFMLVPDARYGTRTGEDGVPGDDDVPVMWPPGYTGRQLSSGEVVVLDASGNVVATTGHVYEVGGGYFDYGNTNVRVWYACSYVREGSLPPATPA